MKARDHRLTSWLYWSPFWSSNLLLVVALSIFLLRLVHLTADFPSQVTWDIGASTDEGFYTGAAINAHTWGSWYLPGDFNAATLLPVWPWLVRCVFAITGMGLVPLRALSVVIAFATCLLLIALLRRYGAERWAPLYVLLLASNPWHYVYTRTGMLETPMVFFFTASLLLAAGRRRDEGSGSPWPRLAAAGIVFAVAMLTKTTVIFVLPAIVVVLGLQRRWQWRGLVRDAAIFLAALSTAYLAWFLCSGRRYLEDIHYFQKVNTEWPKLTLRSIVADVSRPFRLGLGSDHLMFAVAVVVIASAVCVPRLRRLFRQPLFAIAAAWIPGTLLLAMMRNQSPARWDAAFLPALPLMAIALLMNEQWQWRRTFVTLLAVSTCVNLAQIAFMILRPQYSVLNASRQMGEIVRQAKGDSVVIGENSGQLALVAGWRPLNLYLHPAPIERELQQDAPQWYVQFVPSDHGRCRREVFDHFYDVRAEGEWPVNLPEGSSLILYRLVPRSPAPGPITLQQSKACTPQEKPPGERTNQWTDAMKSLHRLRTWGHQVATRTQ